jgi:hypothetical protein
MMATRPTCASGLRFLEIAPVLVHFDVAASGASELVKNNFQKMQRFTSTQEISHDKVNLKFFLA